MLIGFDFSLPIAVSTENVLENVALTEIMPFWCECTEIERV